LMKCVLGKGRTQLDSRHRFAAPLHQTCLARPAQQNSLIRTSTALGLNCTDRLRIERRFRQTPLHAEELPQISERFQEDRGLMASAGPENSLSAPRASPGVKRECSPKMLWTSAMSGSRAAAFWSARIDSASCLAFECAKAQLIPEQRLVGQHLAWARVE